MWKKALEFLLIGFVLFCINDLLPLGPGGLGPDAREPVTIRSDEIRELCTDFSDKAGHGPNALQWEALIADLVNDRLLSLEARQLSLGEGDNRIRRRMIQKARAVSQNPGQSDAELYAEAVTLGLDEDLVVQRLLRDSMRQILSRKPGGMTLEDGEIRAYIETHPEDPSASEVISFSHVFLSKERHGAHLLADATEMLRRLRHDAAAMTALPSDAFILGQTLEGQNREQISRYFGEDFERAVFLLKPDNWSGPLASPYGLHLVRVTHQAASPKTSPEAIRAQSIEELTHEKEDANLIEALKRLRGLYTVRYEANDGQVLESPDMLTCP